MHSNFYKQMSESKTNEKGGKNELKNKWNSIENMFDSEETGVEPEVEIKTIAEELQIYDNMVQAFSSVIECNLVNKQLAKSLFELFKKTLESIKGYFKADKFTTEFVRFLAQSEKISRFILNVSKKEIEDAFKIQGGLLKILEANEELMADTDALKLLKKWQDLIVKLNKQDFSADLYAQPLNESKKNFNLLVKKLNYSKEFNDLDLVVEFISSIAQSETISSYVLGMSKGDIGNTLYGLLKTLEEDDKLKKDEKVLNILLKFRIISKMRFWLAPENYYERPKPYDIRDVDAIKDLIKMGAKPYLEDEYLEEDNGLVLMEAVIAGVDKVKALTKIEVENREPVYHAFFSVKAVEAVISEIQSILDEENNKTSPKSELVRDVKENYEKVVDYLKNEYLVWLRSSLSKDNQTDATASNSASAHITQLRL